MFSFHTHTEFCDGKSTIIEFCQKAIELGMTAVAFTSHAPVSFKNTFSLKFEDLLVYKQQVCEAKERYKGQLNVLIGLEADYIPNETVSFDNWRNILQADLIVGSVHMIKHPDGDKNWFIDGNPSNYHNGLKAIFNDDIKKAVSSYFSQMRQMVVAEKPDVIGHLDKIKMNNHGLYFNTLDSFYVDEMSDTLDVIKSSGCIVEINSRGIYKGKIDETFPSLSVIKKCVEMNIPLTLASDSHHVDDLKRGFDLSLQVANEAGVKTIQYHNGQNWIEKPLQEYLYQ